MKVEATAVEDLVKGKKEEETFEGVVVGVGPVVGVGVGAGLGVELV